MKSIDTQIRQGKDIERAMYPQTGDWWHDHYCPYCLVLKVTEEDQITMPISEFVKLLSYDTMPNKLWASSVRKEGS